MGSARCAAAAVLVAAAVLLRSIERCFTRKAEAGREYSRQQDNRQPPINTGRRYTVDVALSSDLFAAKADDEVPLRLLLLRADAMAGSEAVR